MKDRIVKAMQIYVSSCYKGLNGRNKFSFLRLKLKHYTKHIFKFLIKCQFTRVLIFECKNLIQQLYKKKGGGKVHFFFADI